MNRKILKISTVSLTAGIFLIAGICTFKEGRSANTIVDIQQSGQIAAARNMIFETETNRSIEEETVENIILQSTTEEETETIIEETETYSEKVDAETQIIEASTETEETEVEIPQPTVTNIVCNGINYNNINEIPQPKTLTDNNLKQISADNITKYNSQIQELVSIVNNYRISNNLYPLEYNNVLSLAAEHRATESAYSDWNMTGYTSDGTMHHYRPNFESASSIFELYNLSGNFGENYARYFLSCAEAVEGWKNSKAHNALMLSTNYNNIGVGIAQDAEGYFYYILLMN